MDAMSDEQLQRGIKALRDGDKRTARRVFGQVVGGDPDNLAAALMHLLSDKQERYAMLLFLLCCFLFLLRCFLLRCFLLLSFLLCHALSPPLRIRFQRSQLKLTSTK